MKMLKIILCSLVLVSSQAAENTGVQTVDTPSINIPQTKPDAIIAINVPGLLTAIRKNEQMAIINEQTYNMITFHIPGERVAVTSADYFKGLADGIRLANYNIATNIFIIDGGNTPVSPTISTVTIGKVVTTSW